MTFAINIRKDAKSIKLKIKPQRHNERNEKRDNFITEHTKMFITLKY